MIKILEMIMERLLVRMFAEQEIRITEKIDGLHSRLDRLGDQVSQPIVKLIPLKRAPDGKFVSNHGKSDQANCNK